MKKGNSEAPAPIGSNAWEHNTVSILGQSDAEYNLEAYWRYHWAEVLSLSTHSAHTSLKVFSLVQ